MPTMTIDSEPVTSTPTSPVESCGIQSGTCPLCGAPLHDATACDRCDWVVGYGRPGVEFRRNPRDLFAGILSIFWPGAGHFYKGHTQMAVALAVGGLLCFLWSITFLMFLGPLILPVYWLGVALNAYFLKDWKHSDAVRQPSASNRAHAAV